MATIVPGQQGKQESGREQADRIRRLAAQLRADILRCVASAGSGHPTSSLSAADLMAVLLARHLHWSAGASPDPRRDDDHLVFSKGHATPLLYAMLRAVGIVDDAELLSYRHLGSRLEGHPVPTLPHVDVATGSLGQGICVSVGIALAAKQLEGRALRVWTLLGDSEMSEGSVWEAFDHARHYALGNLVAILDMNRLGQRGPTPLGWNGAAYVARAESFGWRAVEIDGHDLAQIVRALDEASRSVDRPTLVVARTVKGKGVSFLEDQEGWHGKALDGPQTAAALAEIGAGERVVVAPPRPVPSPARPAPARTGPVVLPRYDRKKPVATRRAYGDALAALGRARADVVVLDAEVSNSTYAEEFAKAHKGRFFEMFVAEQQMVAAGVGFSVRGFVPFVSTFAAFLTRAHDFLRMAAVSRADLKVCGSHAGVSIGEDGPSQMGLEDLAMMRGVHGSTVLYPCCANQTAALVARMAETPGIVYLRTTRGATDVLYDPAESFPVGGSKVLRKGADVTIVAAGITVHEALGAAAALASRHVDAQVVDTYSVKPLDDEGIRAAVRATRGNVVVVEDHSPEGGLGEAVRTALLDASPVAARMVHLAVREMPGSGTPAELLRASEIDAAAITQAALSLVAPSSRPAPSSRRGGQACFACGAAARWRILVGGEDEAPVEEDACEVHARAHLRVRRLPAPAVVRA